MLLLYPLPDLAELLGSVFGPHVWIHLGVWLAGSVALTVNRLVR